MTDYEGFKQEDFQHIHDLHWEIEQYHRSIKQICNIERFQVRTGVAIMNHIFASLCCFVQLQKMTATALIANAYRWKRELYMEIVAAYYCELRSHCAAFKYKIYARCQCVSPISFILKQTP